MTNITIITLLMTLSLGFIFFLLYCWAVKKGQFSDIEEAKYLMFRGEDSSYHENDGKE